MIRELRSYISGIGSCWTDLPHCAGPGTALAGGGCRSSRARPWVCTGDSWSCRCAHTQPDPRDRVDKLCGSQGVRPRTVEAGDFSRAVSSATSGNGDWTFTSAPQHSKPSRTYGHGRDGVAHGAGDAAGGEACDPKTRLPSANARPCGDDAREHADKHADEGHAKQKTNRPHLAHCPRAPPFTPVVIERNLSGGDACVPLQRE